jgi:hypothetical protein
MVIVDRDEGGGGWRDYVDPLAMGEMVDEYRIGAADKGLRGA